MYIYGFEIFKQHKFMITLNPPKSAHEICITTHKKLIFKWIEWNLGEKRIFTFDRTMFLCCCCWFFFSSLLFMLLFLRFISLFCVHFHFHFQWIHKAYLKLMAPKLKSNNASLSYIIVEKLCIPICVLCSSIFLSFDEKISCFIVSNALEHARLRFVTY